MYSLGSGWVLLSLLNPAGPAPCIPTLNGPAGVAPLYRGGSRGLAATLTVASPSRRQEFYRLFMLHVSGWLGWLFYTLYSVVSELT